MEKPYRFIRDVVAEYTEEGAAFFRRRRARSQSFVRITRADGSIRSPERTSSVAEPCFELARELLELGE
ncbi:MAG: hypothetical protein ACR2K6_06065 [Solirubrobacterales bacterium]